VQFDVGNVILDNNSSTKEELLNIKNLFKSWRKTHNLD